MLKENTTRRRWWRDAATLILAVPATGRGAEPAFADGAVTLVVPFPPGGGTDGGARILAQRLAQRWQLPVMVENRAGVAGLVGAAFVARARPDGRTLLMGNVGTQAINPSLYADMPYDSGRAFAPVAQVAELPLVLVVHPAVPARSARELVALAQAQPGRLSYASSGSGGAPHMAAEMFKQQTGCFIVHMPYRGGGPALAELVAGRVQLAFLTVLEASPRIRTGALRALAVTSIERVQAIAEVPTLAETVAPGFHFISWIGLLAPQRTPAALIERISAEVREVLAEREVRERLLQIGGLPAASTPTQFGRLIEQERRRLALVISERGIHIE